jgi:hypothetical protein
MIKSPKFKLYARFFSDPTFHDDALMFNSMEEAKNIFQYARGLFLSSHGIHSSSDPAELNTSLFATVMSRYSFALQAFKESNSQYFTPKEEIAMAVLQLNVLSSYLAIYIGFSPPDKKARWEDFMPQINEMIELSQRILSSTSSSDSGGSTIFFCLDMGIVMPLYTLASQCEDSTIRRKAIALLRSTSRQEGPWNSVLVADAVERIMEFGETVWDQQIAPIPRIGHAYLVMSLSSG